MDELEKQAFRDKFSTPKNSGLCLDCNQLPKQKPYHRCYWCKLKKDGTDAEVSAAHARQTTNLGTGAGSWWYEGIPSGFCTDCDTHVPTSYMKTKKRCRGCELARVRDRDAQTKYGLAGGQRQAMFDAQGGKCWGCGNAQKFTGLSVHHSHLTGEAFFLACYACNKLVMGNAQDNPRILLRLALGMLFPLDKAKAMVDEILEEASNG